MTNVLKLGGGKGVEHGAPLRNLAERVSGGERWVLVHGASDSANTLGEQLGHPPQLITSPGGHVSRYNDARTIDIYAMATAAVNQALVAELCGYGTKAVGLGGPAIVRAERKAAIRAIRDGRQVVIRDDYSGKISGVDAALLNALLDAGFMPVVAPLALGAEGERLNVDGDLVAATIAKALEAESLVILSNVPGLLRDVSDPASLIGGFGLGQVPAYESVAGGRMKKKLLAAQEAAVGRFIMADSRIERPLDAALAGGGTHITR